MKTFEDIDIRDYRPIELVFALLSAMLIEGYFRILRLTCTIDDNNDVRTIPDRALIVTYHGESYIDLVCLNFVKRLVTSRDFYWIGFHGFLSYLAILTTVFVKARCFRFDSKRCERPIDQVLHFLRTHPSVSLALRTDAGGPYWKVRRSLLAMAAVGERPIVGVRFFASKKLTLRKHYLPLPFSKITVQIRPVIPYSELKDLSEDQAIAKVTNMMGRLSFNFKTVIRHHLPSIFFIKKF